MSADTDLRRVTVVAPRCADAEVAATAMLVGGSPEAPALARRMDCTWWCARDLQGRTFEGGPRC